MSRALAAAASVSLPNLGAAADQAFRLAAAVVLIAVFYAVFFAGFALFFTVRLLSEPARRLRIRRQFGQWTLPAAPEELFVPSAGRRG